MAVSKVTLNGDTLMDITDTTAAADDVASGEYFYTAAGVKTAGTSSGGGSVDVEEKDVNFYDYDGTRLYSYTAAEAQALSALPANPTHTGLTAQGWNWTLAEIKAQLTAVGGYVNVGQHYVTTDGVTEIDVVFDDPDYLHPYIGFAVNGTIVVDWGDNSETSTLTGTSNTTVKSTGHVYSSTGKYTIKVTVSSGQFTMRSGNYSGIFHITESDTSYWNNNIYSSAVRAVRTGSNAIFDRSAFQYCSNLETVTVPSTWTISSTCDYVFNGAFSLKFGIIPAGTTDLNSNTFALCAMMKRVSIPYSITSIGANAFTQCKTLNHFTFPSGLQIIGKTAFYNCTTLEKVRFPSGMTIIPETVCYSCTSLRELSLPNTAETIGQNAFSNPFALVSITIPANVTSIATNAFSGLYGTSEIHFKGTTPPTLVSTSFSAIRSSCTIYVPTGYLSAYTSAQYYPSSATYTYVEE